MELLLFLLNLILVIYILYGLAYILFYAFALLSSPVYIVYKAFTSDGEERKKYRDSLKGLLLLFTFFLLIFFLIK